MNRPTNPPRKRNKWYLVSIALGMGFTLALLTILGHFQPRAAQAEGAADEPEGSSVTGLAVSAGWTAVGEYDGDTYGNSTATAGDVNGDGFSDLIVGAANYPSGTMQGRAYLYLGGSEGLEITPALTLTGQTAGARFGASVRSAGDVNGDGYADVVIGAMSYLTQTGRFFLYLGSAAGLESSPALTITGENESDAFGRAGSAGDVNGDGYADVIVTANNYPSGTGQGKVYLYQGSAAGLDPSPVFSATGEQVGINFGVRAGTAGDVNGDGYADVIVGASRYDANNLGRIYLYYGSPTGLSATNLMTVTGSTYNERLGVRVATAGDVNGDGYADVVVGADYYGGQSGRAYVFAGGPTGLDPNPIFAESDGSPHFGRAVGPAGDLNGDGYADIVVGTSTYPGFTTRRGRIFVYLGSATGPDGEPDFIQDGENAYDYFGNEVGTAGDVDGDGFSELFASGYGYPNNARQGKVYLFSNGLGRSVLPRQLRGDDSGLPVQSWGLSYAPDGMTVLVNATSPLGRAGVSLQVETCPPGTPFGDASCLDHVTPGWTDVTSSTAGVVLSETLTGLASDTVYRWRARVLYDSPINPHGPWRRYLASSLEADLRVGLLPDVTIQKTVTPDIVGPGQALTYTLAFANAGSLLAADVTIVDPIPAILTEVTYRSSWPVTPTGVFSYTWEVGNLDDGEGGVITVTGTVDPSASGLFDLVNQTEISTSVSDGDLSNNTSIVTSTVDAESPTPPALVSPVDGALISDATPTLTWQPSPSPDVAGYWLDLDGAVMDPGDVVSYTTEVLADGVYTWTVAAYDGVGNTSAYTDVWSFEIDASAPEILLTSPADGAVEVALSAPVLITFSEVIDTVTFSYTVAPDPGGWEVVWNGSGNVVTLTHGGWTGDTLCSFTVLAADDLAGNPLLGAPVTWSFSTESGLFWIYLPLVGKGF